LQVFVSGGTGYIGQRLIRLLAERRHAVSALARPSSAKKLPSGCATIIGDAMNPASFAGKVGPTDTFVHLVGVSHPAPWKEAEFRVVDLAAVNASLDAAVRARVRHFVYVSVAQPAPLMKSHIQVRAECEDMIPGSGLNATFVRPWYVLGPGHWWPVVLMPFYWLFEHIPSERDTALRLGLVTIHEMVAALAWAVENPSAGVRTIAVPEIRTTAARLGLVEGGGAAASTTAIR
jgi:uncharacterized protein YbjT (DUF2867 family)